MARKLKQQRNNVLCRNLPITPGVYIMRGAGRRVLYIGKAVNLRRRVNSYFIKNRLNRSSGEYVYGERIKRLVLNIKTIETQKTDTALEAVMLEARLIKKYQPPYNVLEKDDKSFLYIEVTAEPFPRILLVREKSLTSGKRYGPFLDVRNVRAALKMLRKIFPYATHTTPDWVLCRNKRPEGTRPCFDYQIGLCPGTCLGAVSRADYRKNIRRLELIFEGKKSRVIRKLKIDMRRASEALEFERAAEVRRRLFGIKHIQDIALISDESKIFQQELQVRIEGYDISNISGTSAVGSMVVFEGGEPNTSMYRKFRIRTVRKSDDIAMLKEVLRRRFGRVPKNGGWPLPYLILIDGGLGQINAARMIIGEAGYVIPVVGIAKGLKRKKNEFVGSIPSGFSEKLLIRVRDEAHRFAIQYHRQVRSLYK